MRACSCSSPCRAGSAAASSPVGREGVWSIPCPRCRVRVTVIIRLHDLGDPERHVVDEGSSTGRPQVDEPGRIGVETASSARRRRRGRSQGRARDECAFRPWMQTRRSRAAARRPHSACDRPARHDDHISARPRVAAELLQRCTRIEEGCARSTPARLSAERPQQLARPAARHAGLITSNCSSRAR